MSKPIFGKAASSKTPSSTDSADIPQAIRVANKLVKDLEPKQSKLEQGYVQLNVMVKQEVKDELKTLAKKNGLKLSFFVEQLLSETLGIKQ